MMVGDPYRAEDNQTCERQHPDRQEDDRPRLHPPDGGVRKRIERLPEALEPLIPARHKCRPARRLRLRIRKHGVPPLGIAPTIPRFAAVRRRPLRLGRISDDRGSPTAPDPAFLTGNGVCACDGDHRSCDQIWIARLATASAASLTASGSVGCAWQVRAISSAAAPNSMATAASAIMLPASGHRIWTPSTRSLLASASILTKPSVSRLTLARGLAEKGNFPTL